MYTVLLSLLLSSSIFAATGAGARGGGTGVTCDGKTVVTIEEHLNSREGYKNNTPKTRAAVKKRVKELFNVLNSDKKKIYKDWEKVWNKIGAYDSWRVLNYNHLKKYILGKDSKFDEIFSILGVDKNDYKASFHIENDDKVIIDNKNCKKVQMSLIDRGRVVSLGHGYKLSERTKRALELHESLFLLGMVKFGHTFPKRTQDIVRKILRNSYLLAGSLYRYGIPNVKAKKLTGFYILDVSGSDLREYSCPKSLVYVAETMGSISETIIHDSGRNSRLAISKNKIESRLLRTSYLGETQAGDEKYRMYEPRPIYYNSSLTRLNRIFAFIEKGGKTESRLMVDISKTDEDGEHVSMSTMRCSYAKVIKPLSEIQLINRVLLNLLHGN